MKNQTSDDPNAWYKDPSHPLYLSNDAMVKRGKIRMASAKAARTRKQNKEAQRLVEQRLGKDLANTVVDRLMALVSPWDFGVGFPSHLNGKTARFPRKLRRSDVFNHLAAKNKNKRLYYTCMPLELGDLALCMVTIDIDNDGHASNDDSNAADLVASDICEKLDNNGISYLRQASTNGNGYHVTLVVSVPSNLSHWGIRDRLVELRSNLAASYLKSGCHEVCLKGLNLLQKNEEVSLYGTLVRMPEISKISVAESFLSMTMTPAPLQTIAPLFACDENGGSETSVTADVVEKEAAGRIHTITRGTTSVVSDPEPQHQGGPNPLKRMHEALRKYRDTHLANPSTPEALVAFYEQLNLHTGKATPARLERATIVWKWAQDPSRGLPSLDAWHARVAEIFKDADLSYTANRRVKFEEAAIFGFLLATKLQSADAAEIPTSYIKNGSLALKKNGQSSCSLNDNKKVAKLFKLFRQRGMIEQIRNHIRGNKGIEGQCRMFRKGPSWGVSAAEPRPSEDSTVDRPETEKGQAARQQKPARVRTTHGEFVQEADEYAWAATPPL